MGTVLHTGEHCRILLPTWAVTPGHLVIEIPGAATRTGGLTDEQAVDVIRAHSLVRAGLRDTSGCDAYAVSLSYGWTSQGTAVGEPEPDGPHPQLHVFGRSAHEAVKSVAAMAVPAAERPHLPHPDPDALRRTMATAHPEEPTEETDPAECGCCVPSVQRDQELWRRNSIRVITPLDPIVPANVLAMPLGHVASLAALSGEELVSLWDRFDETVMHLGVEVLSTFVNDGGRAAQRIPHVHVHVLGRSATEPATPRSIIRAAEWTLAEETAEGAPRAIFRVECIMCGAESQAVDNEPDPVELWALRHTGLNPRHRQFKLTTEWFWRVCPSPGNPYFDLEKGNEGSP